MKRVLWLFAIWLASSLPVMAADLLKVSSVLKSSDPTQLGRLSRSSIPSNWSAPKAYPGTLNTSTSYHYEVFAVNVATTTFVQISMDDPTFNLFASAYLDSYIPASEATNYLGDAGFSGQNIGDDRYFQVIVPANHTLLVVVNDTVANNGGVGTPFTIQVQGFLDNQYTTDINPPVTTASLAPLPNSNGWNTKDVAVTLNAVDNPGGTGVKQIQYFLSGAQTLGPQVVPGSTAAVAISAQGATNLTYFATDYVGNVEQAKTLTVKIDKTPPLISGMPTTGCTLWPPDHKLVQVAVVTASDVASGLAPGSVTVKGTSNEPMDLTDPAIVITPNSSGGFVVQLQADRLGSGNGRVYTVTASASDLAGNTTNLTATCTVPHDQSN
jgi:hypothetical protein